MRLVHLSDLHLGYRQYQRLTPLGANQRERDVATSFTRAIEHVIALAPDLVVIAGDVFHSVRPSNPAILHAFNEFTRLSHALPETPIVIAAGNHDVPRSGDTISILRLFESIGIHVAVFEPRRLAFPKHGLSVLAVPDVAPPDARLIDLRPDSSARYNVLVLHGEHREMQPEGPVIDHIRLLVNADDLHPERWTYVALGHDHVRRQIAPNAYYSGALDYTSTGVWAELAAEQRQRLSGKSFIEYDMDRGAITFHPLPPSRRLIELPSFNARGKTGAEVDVAVREVVESCPGGIDDAIVRLVIREVPRHINSDLDQAAIRQYRRRAFHFQMELIRPSVRPPQGSGAPGHPQSLADFVRERLLTRNMPPDVDRDTLVGRVFSYLEEATAAELAAGEEAPG